MSALARFTSFSSHPMDGPPRRLAQGRKRGLLARAGLMALAGAGLVAGGLAIATGLLEARQPAGQALAATLKAPARWSEIHHPMALYDLAGTEFAKRPADYRARHRDPDGAREDVMTFGQLGDGKPYLQLTLLRSGTDAAPSTDGLADALARLAGMRGLTATRFRPAAPVDTRLGRVEASDLLLWDGGTATPCLGFRGMAEGGRVLGVSGFACGAAGRPVGRAALACALDRLDLRSAGDDAALRAVFVAAERRGGASCPGASATASGGSFLTMERRLGWLDPEGNLPPLRGLFDVAARQR